MDCARQLLKLATQEVEAATALGIDVSLDERLLELAAHMIDRGYHVTAEGYRNKGLDDISEQRARIAEASVASLSVVVLWASLSAWTRQQVCR